jgi:hypothetical protein
MLSNPNRDKTREDTVLKIEMEERIVQPRERATGAKLITHFPTFPRPKIIQWEKINYQLESVTYD